MAELEAVLIEIEDKTYAVPLDTVKAFEVSDEVKAQLEEAGDDVSGFMNRYIIPGGGGTGVLDYPNNYQPPTYTPPSRAVRR